MFEATEVWVLSKTLAQSFWNRAAVVLIESEQVYLCVLALSNPCDLRVVGFVSVRFYEQRSVGAGDREIWCA